MAIPEEYRKVLRKAYNERNLTLYIGAGVSVGNGLPTWGELVLTMYIDRIRKKQNKKKSKASCHYLYAVSKWYIERSRESLEITAQKLRTQYKNEGDFNEDEFMDSLHSRLYGKFLEMKQTIQSRSPEKIRAIRNANQTLNAIADLCEEGFKKNPRKGVKSIVTYNYDFLLELVLKDCATNILPGKTPNDGQIPVYHAHGYIPLDRDNHEASSPSDIILTEEDYHRVQRETYHWSNVVQIMNMADSVGLMVGLSLTDRNMRRILNILSQTELQFQTFAFLRKPKWEPPDDKGFNSILDTVKKKEAKYKASGLQKDFNFETDEINHKEIISKILNDVAYFDKESHEETLKELGVIPIWYRETSDIPQMIKSIWNQR